MKLLVNIARALVGMLFIFSGVVKANDPMGLSYKMQEFFLVWGVSYLDKIALPLSVIMIAIEIVAGAALLLGWKPKWVNRLLLLLIVFFTFLTGYAYLSGKFKNCGCFGDCIPITAKASFIKDIILFVLIVFLLLNARYIKQIFKNGVTVLLLLAVTIFSFVAQWYTLKYLPLADCLPFKPGGNIPALLKLPADAVADSTVITFEYEKDGKPVSFTAETFPADFNDSTYTFIKRYDKIIKPGYNNEPPIKSFSLTNAAGTDVAPEVLQAKQVLLLFVENDKTPFKSWQSSFEHIYTTGVKKNIPVFLVTSAMPAVKQAIVQTGFNGIPIVNGDNTMIRTAARTNPTLYLLQSGTVMYKWSYKNFDEALGIINSLASLTPEKQRPTADSIVTKK